MSRDLERIILENPVESKLWETARASGMLTIQEDAMIKAFANRVPFSEVKSLSSLLLSEEEKEEVKEVVSEETPSEKKTIKTDADI